MGARSHAPAPAVVRVAVLSVAAVSVLGFVWFVERVTWPCPVRVWFHVPCPSCGLTRATFAALRGHWVEATALHPLWLLVVPLAAGAMATEFGGYAMRGRWGALPGLIASRWLFAALWVALAAMLVVWVARFFGAFGGPVPV